MRIAKEKKKKRKRTWICRNNKSENNCKYEK